jgi:hypothetical protein
LDEELLAANVEALEEMRIVTVTAQPQRDLQQAEQDKRQEEQRQAKKPESPSGERLWGSSRVSARRMVLFASTAQPNH